MKKDTYNLSQEIIKLLYNKKYYVKYNRNSYRKIKYENIYYC